MRISFLIFCFVSIQLSAQNRKIENLVFEGAGIRGIAYAGVIQELENQKVMDSIQKVGGTSAGAITALMVSLGYHANEIEILISETKFQKFNDGNFFFLGGFHRINQRFGWYKTIKFEKWLAAIIEKKTNDPNITFSQLKDRSFKDLYVTGTCLNQQKLIVFSYESYPHMKIKDAVRISMSIPLYFESGFIDQEGTLFKKNTPENSLDIVVDGGIVGNFPIFIFDSIQKDSLGNTKRIENLKTIGVRIDSDEQIQRDQENKGLEFQKIENLTDYMVAFYTLVLENLNRNELSTSDWNRTISVSSIGIPPKIKKLNPTQKSTLIESGRKATQLFLNKK